MNGWLGFSQLVICNKHILHLNTHISHNVLLLQDGFYKGHSADNKQVGLIPSNFVERVNEGTESIVGLCYPLPHYVIGIGDGTRRRHKSSTKRRMLQHIDEESENDPNSEKSTTGKMSGNSWFRYNSIVPSLIPNMI